VACPFFYPTTRAEAGSWVIAPRLPLADAYLGECRARSVAFVPDAGRVEQTCNAGYARSCCDRFPGDAPADAVRFHVIAEDAERIQVQFTFERGCWPAGHGVLEYSISRAAMEGEGTEILKAQAAGFVAGYLRRSR
jgi:hypothetical protein